MIERLQFALSALSLVLALNCQPNDDVSLPVDCDIFTIGDDCTVCYDRRTHTARWVSEKLTWEDLQGNAARADRFFVPDIPDEFRPSLNDYRGSGYDRGHFAPAADFQSDQAAMDASFMLANMVPQNRELNRGLWAALEQQIRDMVQPGMKVEIVTTAIYVAHKTGGMQFAMAGRSWVPTHCGKTILIDDGGTLKTFAWIVPNVAPKRSAKPDDFLVSVDRLEIASGVDCFSSLPDGIEREIER